MADAPARPRCMQSPESAAPPNHAQGAAPLTRHYAALDGVRAIAVLMVISYHAGNPFHLNGGMGVIIFFVLSGFLITGILSEEIQNIGRIRFGNFYLRRVLRLMPALVLATALFAVLFTYASKHFPGRVVLICLTYTANWIKALTQISLEWMDHCWSLACEEQFYLVWPLVVF